MIHTTIEERTENGWARVVHTIEVEVKPRWWEFWKREIPHQTFTASLWMKELNGGEIVQYGNTLESDE